MITRKGVDPGQWAKPDSDLVELVAVDTIRVRAPLPQRYYTRVAVGAPARVQFEAMPERVFDGTVFAKVAAGDAATRSFPLLIDIPNPEHLLAPGMSARVDVELYNGETEALVVPRDAVITRVGGERMVWRVDGSQDPPVAERVVIRTGRAYRDHLEVLGEALAPGDRVVLLGNENLRPGTALKVLEAAPTAAGR
jgi:RND family efflux transporter MFP subunit